MPTESAGSNITTLSVAPLFRQFPWGSAELHNRVVDEVHAAGGVIIPKLWHCGSIRTKGMEPDPNVPGFAPSPLEIVPFERKHLSLFE